MTRSDCRFLAACVILLLIAGVVYWQFFSAREAPIATTIVASASQTVIASTQRQQWEALKAQRVVSAQQRRPNYSESLSAADITSIIRRLAASSEPNDWYKAFALNIKCRGTYGDKVDIETLALSTRKNFVTPETKTTPEAEAAWQAKVKEWLETSPYMQIRNQVKQQCGEAAQALSPIEPDLVKRAREAGAPLALAPLSTWGNYPDGLTVEQQERVRAVLADPDGRTAWLSVNNQRISMMIDKSGVFPDATSSEIHSALVLSLCYFGDDCSAKSLYMIDVCAASLNCGAGAVEDVIFANAPLARQSIVSATALAIALGIQRGDLSGIGLIKSAPTKGK